MWVKPFLAKGDYNEIEGNQVFAIQELNPLSNWVKTIHAITSTTKDPHFRIVCHKHVIATADSLSAIRINFIWLTDNLLSQLLSIDEQLDFVIAKVSSLVANTDTSVMLDDAFVQAFYSFSSLFKINEPLVNCISC